jgi:hypothetical protein
LQKFIIVNAVFINISGKNSIRCIPIIKWYFDVRYYNIAVAGDFMCPSGKNVWKHEQCMVFSVCGECTGYGAGCVSANRPDR